MRDLIFRLGLLLIVIGSIAFLLAQSRIQYYGTLEGVLTRAGHSAEEKVFQMWLSIRIWSMAAAGVSYLLMTMLAWLSVKTEKRVLNLKRWIKPTVPLINICKSCGTMNNPKAKFCKKCASKLEI